MIHPRRLKGTPANVARYYTVGDYYTKGDAEHSEWGGRIASDLGLSGPVDPGIFQDLLAGDVRGQQLGRRRAEGQIEHHPGWDFAVNAPKSVSIMALVRGDERIIDAHERAVGTAISYLEEHAELRRRAGGDVVHETSGRLLYARFTEHASRELDPHLHTHVVVLNMTNRQDGERMASLEARAMYAQQMTAGQVYRNDLAHRLRELGYDIEFDPRLGLFEIAGVPNRMIREMSQRAEQIDAHARSHGLSGQAARRQSFYETRGPKAKATLDELRTRWTGRAKPHEEALDRIGDRVAEKGEQAIVVEPALGARATLFGVRQSEVTEAVNDYGRMLRVALASHVGEVRSSDVRPRLDEHEVRRKLLSTRGQTGDAILTRGRTTRQTARRELALTGHIALAANDARPIASSDRLLAVLPDAGLSPGQEQALPKSPPRTIGSQEFSAWPVLENPPSLMCSAARLSPGRRLLHSPRPRPPPPISERWPASLRGRSQVCSPVPAMASRTNMCWCWTRRGSWARDRRFVFSNSAGPRARGSCCSVTTSRPVPSSRASLSGFCRSSA